MEEDVNGVLDHGGSSSSKGSASISQDHAEICLLSILLNTIPSHIKQVSCDEAHTAVLTNDDELYTLGYNRSNSFLFPSLGASGNGDAKKGDMIVNMDNQVDVIICQ